MKESSELSKRIAKAIKDAFGKREASWNGKLHKYTKNYGDCFQEACEQNGVPHEMWYLLYLTNHWGNDILAWADDVLADRFDEAFGDEHETNKAQI